MTAVIYRNLENLPPTARGHVVAIGNFDGVHLGHQRVIAAASRESAACGVALGVLMFAPNPRQFFQPDAPPSELMPIAARARVLQEYGVKHVYVQRFDAAFSHLSPDAFLSQVLKNQLNASHIVVGENFHFGHRRMGNLDFLRRHGPEYGMGVVGVPADRSVDGVIYSSTRVRECLSAGRMEDARKILGRPFEIEGEVMQGDHVAAGLGYPTANVRLGGYHRPRYGVYAVRAQVVGEAEWHNGVANVGIRPTVGGGKEWLEVHLMNMHRNLYGKNLRVRFYDFIRPEQKFESLDALKQQIARDIHEATQRLA